MTFDHFSVFVISIVSIITASDVSLLMFVACLYSVDNKNFVEQWVSSLRN
jgi:hypothetical protein